MPNLHPTITADQLATYLVSPPTRRAAILERAKYGDLYTDPHTKTRELAVDVMLGRVLPDELPTAAMHVRGGPDLVAFFSRWEQEHTAGPVERRPMLGASGVQITGAAPDVLTKHRVGHRTRIGGVAFAFEPLHSQQARARCALMHRALERCCEPECAFTTEAAAIVVSLPTGATLYGGPFATAWRDIEAACEEIRRMWPTV